jgi:hypothetical protein
VFDLSGNLLAAVAKQLKPRSFSNVFFCQAYQAVLVERRVLNKKAFLAKANKSAHLLSFSKKFFSKNTSFYMQTHPTDWNL